MCRERWTGANEGPKLEVVTERDASEWSLRTKRLDEASRPRITAGLTRRLDAMRCDATELVFVLCLAQDRSSSRCCGRRSSGGDYCMVEVEGLKKVGGDAQVFTRQRRESCVVQAWQDEDLYTKD